jgi:hypothetical protein
MVADVQLDEPGATVAADDRVREIEILDYSLQLAAIAVRDFAAKDHRDLVRLADGAVRIQQPLTQLIESGRAEGRSVVAMLDLRKRTDGAGSRRRCTLGW